MTIKSKMNIYLGFGKVKSKPIGHLLFVVVLENIWKVGVVLIGGVGGNGRGCFKRIVGI